MNRQEYISSIQSSLEARFAPKPMGMTGNTNFCYTTVNRIVSKRYRQESKLCVAPIVEESTQTVPDTVPVAAGI